MLALIHKGRLFRYECQMSKHLLCVYMQNLGFEETVRDTPSLKYAKMCFIGEDNIDICKYLTVHLQFNNASLDDTC